MSEQGIIVYLIWSQLENKCSGCEPKNGKTEQVLQDECDRGGGMPRDKLNGQRDLQTDYIYILASR